MPDIVRIGTRRCHEVGNQELGKIAFCVFVRYLSHDRDGLRTQLLLLLLLLHSHLYSTDP
jgi:hypothetical protein